MWGLIGPMRERCLCGEDERKSENRAAKEKFPDGDNYSEVGNLCDTLLLHHRAPKLGMCRLNWRLLSKTMLLAPS